MSWCEPFCSKPLYSRDNRVTKIRYCWKNGIPSLQVGPNNHVTRSVFPQNDRFMSYRLVYFCGKHSFRQKRSPNRTKLNQLRWISFWGLFITKPTCLEVTGWSLKIFLRYTTSLYIFFILFWSYKNNENSRSRWAIFSQLQCLTNAVGDLCWGHGTIIRVQQPMKNTNNKFQSFFLTQSQKYENKRNKKHHVDEDNER